MCQGDQTKRKKIKKLRKAGEPEYLIRWHRKNWAGLCRNALTDPVQKRKPDAGPKWYEFKVVPLSNKYYNILHAPRPPSSYLMRPLEEYNNLGFFRGREAYVEFDGTSPEKVWSHSGEEKYFLFPSISPTKLFHWPNFKKSLTDEPINYEKALKNIAEGRYDAFRSGCRSHAQFGDDLAFSGNILYYAARTGESVSAFGIVNGVWVARFFVPRIISRRVKGINGIAESINSVANRCAMPRYATQLRSQWG